MGPDLLVQGRGEAATKAAHGQDADHRRVIGAQFGLRKMHPQAPEVAFPLQLGTKEAVAGDPSRRRHAPDAEPKGGLEQFAHEDIHDGCLRTGTNVSQTRRVRPSLGMPVEMISHGSFKSAETEVVPAVAEEGPRKGDSLGVAFPGQFVDRGTARVRQPKKLGDLVKALACRVVQRGSENPVAKFAFHVDQEGMTAAGDERNVGHERGVVRLPWLAGDPWRIQVRLMMMDPDKGPPQGERERLSDAAADQQSLRQAGTQSGRDSVNVPRGDSRVSKRPAGDFGQIPEVLARGEFGNHAAVGRVGADLGGNQQGPHGVAVNHGDAGLVAGRLEREKAHNTDGRTPDQAR